MMTLKKNVFFPGWRVVDWLVFKCRLVEGGVQLPSCNWVAQSPHHKQAGCVGEAYVNMLEEHLAFSGLGLELEYFAVSSS